MLLHPGCCTASIDPFARRTLARAALLRERQLAVHNFCSAHFLSDPPTMQNEPEAVAPVQQPSSGCMPNFTWRSI
jgi:hypothetical protein